MTAWDRIDRAHRPREIKRKKPEEGGTCASCGTGRLAWRPRECADCGDGELCEPCVVCADYDGRTLACSACGYEPEDGRR
jgi:hypothetical protein